MSDKECSDSNEQNCTKCLDPVPFLYKGKCLKECKNGTFLVSNNTDENKICEDCYENCKTCKERGTPSDMHCESCSKDKIQFKEQCYIIHDEKNKTFYHPEDSNIITSCFELYNRYIKENTNEWKKR